MLNRARLMKDENGFTLIELLIVIVILGVLSAVVVFSVGGVTDRGTAAACKADKATISVAAEAYYAKKGTYPGDITAVSTAPDKFLSTGLAPTTTVVWSTTAAPVVTC